MSDNGLATGDIQKRFMHGAGIDEVLAEEDRSIPSTAFWALSDQIGTIRDWVGAEITSLKIHARYSTFGQQLDSLGSFGFTFGFTGRETDADTLITDTWMYYRARYYDPATGRFVSQDPIGFSAGDANLYRYVSNGPTSARDPSGLEEKPRVPASIRGEWIKGTPGQGTFKYGNSAWAKNAGVAGAKIRFHNNHIALGGSPAAWYYGGSAASASVPIDKVTGGHSGF